jgi:hypothetical protein
MVALSAAIVGGTPILALAQATPPGPASTAPNGADTSSGQVPAGVATPAQNAAPGQARAPQTIGNSGGSSQDNSSPAAQQMGSPSRTGMTTSGGTNAGH